MWRATIASATVDMPTASAPIARRYADLGRRLVARPVQARRRRRARAARPFVAAARSATARSRFEYTSVMSGNRGPNRSSFGPMSGLVPIRLMWSSITISAPCENDVLMPPAALVSSSVFTPSAAIDARREDDGRHRVALRRSARAPTAPPPACPRTVPTTSLPAWPITVAGGQPGNRLVGHARSASPTCDAKSPSPEPSTMAMAGAAGIALPDERRRRLHARVFVAHSRNPAMVAVMKFASVPASIARRPRRARSCRRLGASAPMPPIWMPIELKFANPHSAKVAIVNDFGSSDGLQRPELRVGHELVEHHARAEQVADGRRVPPRHAHRPGDRREHPAQDLLQAQVRQRGQPRYVDASAPRRPAARSAARPAPGTR